MENNFSLSLSILIYLFITILMMYKLLIEKDNYSIIIADKRWEKYFYIFKIIHIIALIKYNMQIDHNIKFNVMLSNKTYMKYINYKFKGIKKDTNVISFINTHFENEIIFDIIISIDFLILEVQLFEIGVYFRLSRLILHGILHCHGYDDNTSENDIIMETQENNILNLIKTFI